VVILPGILPLLTPGKASLHGMICADGTVHCGLYRKKHPKWTYLLQLADPNASIRQLFAKHVRIEYGLTARDRPLQGVIRAYGKGMAIDMMRYGPFGRLNWAVPFGSLNRLTARNWLRSFFDGDGDVHLSLKISKCMVRAKSINELGLKGVNTLLWHYFKIRGKIYAREKPTRENWSQAYEFNIFNKRNLSLYARNIGFNHPEKQRKLLQLTELL
jgi:LAGLIDADG-like domain